MNRNSANSVINSALWAAYGDALGFITELTDIAGVHRRAKTDFVEETVSWKRVVGGQFGGQVQLPAGCYSDDTQLRLATSRAIRPDGSFDVDAFAKIELPVFDAYSLGAGNATKAAAKSLGSQSVTWFSNFYKQGKANYIEAGGNGGVMRIQPHVWCDFERGFSLQAIRGIIRNVLCTHGHPRALAGAIFHGFQLSLALSQREIQHPSDWKYVIGEMSTLADLIKNDEQLGIIWLPTWEQGAKQRWDVAWKATLDELFSLVESASRWALKSGPMEENYLNLINEFGADSDKFRGEAMRTAVLAQFLAWCSRKDSPMVTVITAANALGSDTDTIASVAGAMRGAVSDETPKGEILDRKYITEEADRMARIARREKVGSFRYPNVLTWQPPRSQLDVVSQLDGRLQVAGLGDAQETGKIFHGRKRDEAWQILSLSFGQTVVIKRRLQLQHSAKSELLMTPPASKPNDTSSVEKKKPVVVTSELPLVDPVSNSEPVKPISETIDSLTNRIIANGIIPVEVGDALLSFAADDEGVEKAIAFCAIIVKAKRARLKKGTRTLG